MNRWIVDNVLFPLHERVIGRPTLRLAHQLDQTQWWPRERLDMLQVSKLRNLLTHAWQEIPYYRQSIDDAGLDVHAINTLDALRQLPLLTRDDVATHRDEMTWPNVPGGLIRSNTGGSTGRPVVFYVDRRRQAAFKAARIRAHQWFGITPGDRELYLWGAPAELTTQDRLKTLRDWLTNEKLLSAFAMSPDRMDAYLDAIEAYRPACIFGYPSSLALLCDHARSRSRSLHLPTLKAVLATGEVLYDHQRDGIAEVFGVPVADGYGSRDGGFIAHHCPDGSMHVTDEYTIVELLDAAGQPVEPGQVGEIVVTDLEAYGLPLIRYRTGDMAAWSDQPCTCGRNLRVLRGIEGRQTDFVVTPDGTVKHALCLIYALRDLPDVRQFRIHQHEDCSITVHVVATTDARDDLGDTVQQNVASNLQADVPIRVAIVDALPPSGSGKHRYVISQAVAPSLQPVHA